MTVNYTFSSYPRPAVVVTATDGRRRLSVTEPVDGIAEQAWKDFEQSGYADAECFISGNSLLQEKLRRTERIMADTLDRIHRDSRAIANGQGIAEYAAGLIAAMEAGSRATKYRNALSVLQKYLAAAGLPDISLAQFDTEAVDALCRYMRGRGLKESTVSFYCRILGAIYHTAVRQGLINDAAPFAAAPMNVSRYKSESTVSPADLHRLITADLTARPDLSTARDILHLAYLTGMNLVQIFSLTPAQAATSRATIAGKSITLGAEARAILNRYTDGYYCFYAPRPGSTRPRNLRSLRNRFLRDKKALAVYLGLTGDLSINTLRACRRR